MGRVGSFDRMAGLGKRMTDALVDAVFELNGRGARAPGAPNEKTRRGQRRSDRLAVAITGEDLGLELRLAIAPHRTVGDEAAVVQKCKGRIEGVEGTPTRPQRIERLRIEREGQTAIGHRHARYRQ